jgi:Fe-S-cluster-containing dehydrogenase component
MKNDRRNFLKSAVLGTMAAATGAKAGNEENKLPEPEVPFDEESVLENFRRPGPDNYTVVNRFKNPDPDGDPVHCKTQCMHCADAACVSACIVNAINKKKEGGVVWEDWKCIGCRYCMIACPFQIPTYEYNKSGISLKKPEAGWKKFDLLVPLENVCAPKVRKCTFCWHNRTSKGEMPACAENCPAEAITFGKRTDMLKEAKKRISEEPDTYLDHVFGEHEVGGTAKLYLAPKSVKDFKFLRLYAIDKKRIGTDKFRNEAVPHLTESIQHSVFKYFIPPLAAYAIFSGIMYKTKPKNGEKDKEGQA